MINVDVRQKHTKSEVLKEIPAICQTEWSEPQPWKSTQIIHTLQGINISHLGKRKIIFNMPFWGDMLVPWRVNHENPRFTCGARKQVLILTKHWRHIGVECVGPQASYCEHICRKIIYICLRHGVVMANFAAHYLTNKLRKLLKKSMGTHLKFTCDLALQKMHPTG